MSTDMTYKIQDIIDELNEMAETRQMFTGMTDLSELRDKLVIWVNELGVELQDLNASLDKALKNDNQRTR